jgi:hypothetical protein
MSETPTPAPYDATPWKGAMEQEFTVELSPGRPFVCRHLSLVEELAAGTLPSELERYVLYEPFDGDEYKMVKGQPKRKSDVELSVEQADRWRNKLRIAARAMIRPRLRLKGEPNYQAGEIAPKDLQSNEINEVAFIAIRRALPPLPAIFQEPAAGEPADLEVSADLRSGELVPQESV